MKQKRVFPKPKLYETSGVVTTVLPSVMTITFEVNIIACKWNFTHRPYSICKWGEPTTRFTQARQLSV